MQSKPPRRLALDDPTEPCWATEDLSVPPANNDQIRSEGLPPGKRAWRVLGRFLIAFGIGVAATLAWRSWGAPPAAPVAEAVSAVASPDQEELKAVWLGLASVRQRVDQIAAQFAAGQEQMTRDINKVQAVEQDILDKISAPLTRPAIAPGTHKPASLTPLPITPPEAQLVH
jgi:hypothetical protein